MLNKIEVRNYKKTNYSDTLASKHHEDNENNIKSNPIIKTINEEREYDLEPQTYIIHDENIDQEEARELADKLTGNKDYEHHSLVLGNLSNINYFVGKNGSGKTTILDSVIFLCRNHIENEKLLYIKEGFEMKITGNYKRGIISISAEYDQDYIHYDKENENIPSMYIKNRNNKKDLQEYNNEFKDNYNEENDADDSITKNSWGDGYKSLNTLFGKIDDLIKEYDELIICIEEPEQFLHPELQKKIPEALERRIKDKNIQFFISTHSPFVISAAAEPEYKDQRVYLIEDGQTRNLKGEKGKGEKGYSGSHSYLVAGEMLGTNVQDFAGKTTSVEDINIIYCEGSSKSEKDSIFYSIIFPEYNGKKNIFLSCKSANDVINSYFKSKGSIGHIIGGSGKVGVYAFVDRSCSFGKGIKVGDGDDDYVKTSDGSIFTDEDYNKFHERHKGENLKMLKSREIENYLFHSTVLKKLQSEITLDKSYDEIKNIKDKFKYQPFYDDLQHSFGGLQKLKERLAQIIYDNRKLDCEDIYTELHECVFGEA